MADLRQAVRALRAAPAFTVVALVVLTLGIGATTAIFSVVDAVVLRALPFDEPDRLVAVGERGSVGKGKRPGAFGPGGPDPSDPQALSPVQPQNYLDWVAQQHVFASIAAIAFGEGTLLEPGAEPENLVVQRVTAGFFDVLRIRPAHGRPFTTDNEVDGSQGVAVLSEAFWKRRFGGNPNVVGRRILLDDARYEVIGIMPPDVTYPVGATRPTDLWIPYVVPESQRTRAARTLGAYLQVIARLEPDVSLERAQAQMDQVAAAIEQANPQWVKDNKIGVRPLRDHLVGASMKSWMLMLLASVGIVLLIACANVANLLLARASTREREVAVRAALGAGRWRLIRQLMIESLVLSVAGTAMAVMLASWTVQVLRSAMPEGVPRVATIALDLRVLAAAACLSLVTGVLCGIVPALQLSRPNLTNSLKDGIHGASAGRGRRRLRGLLVVAEVALAVVLLVGAGLFIGSFMALMRVDPGFKPDRVLTVDIISRVEPGQRPPDLSATFGEIAERLGKVPGVVHASMSRGGVPFAMRLWVNNLRVPGRTFERDPGVSIKVVTPDYHKALGIPLRSGRLFDATDYTGGPNAMIINDSAAKTYFPGEDPVGRTVSLNGADRTVVGVVGDVRQRSLEAATLLEVYLPMSQTESSYGEVVVRTSVDPYDVLPAVKSVVLAALPDVPLRSVKTMDELVFRETAQRRLNMLMLGLFGLLGLVISAVGIYGVMAYVVSQRTREIGVRMALGATRSTVLKMVLTNASALVAVGLIVGGVAAWYLSATAKTFLFGLQANDPRAFAAAIVSLSLAALVASIIPARRAASVDPTVALRAE